MKQFGSSCFLNHFANRKSFFSFSFCSPGFTVFLTSLSPFIKEFTKGCDGIWSCDSGIAFLIFQIQSGVMKFEKSHVNVPKAFFHIYIQEVCRFNIECKKGRALIAQNFENSSLILVYTPLVICIISHFWNFGSNCLHFSESKASLTSKVPKMRNYTNDKRCIN